MFANVLQQLTPPDFDSPIAYLAVFLILLAVFMILAGLDLLAVEKLKIKPGNRTLAAGVVCLVIGVLLLSLTSSTSEPISTATPFSSTTQNPPSSNMYEQIPLVGDRSTLFDADDPEKNLDLIEFREIDSVFDLAFYPSTGTLNDENPQLWYVFEPEFVTAYARVDENEEPLYEYPEAIGIRTGPGQTISIPQTSRTIYGGRFIAMVLFADESSLAFTYSRKDGVDEGYTVYYEGIVVDSSLLNLYRKSQGNILPGLEANVPVGHAEGSQIRVAIKKDGVFVDARLAWDWWQGFADN